MTISVWSSGVVTGEERNWRLSYQLVGDTRHPKTNVIEVQGGEPRIQELFLRYSHNSDLVNSVEFKLEAIEVIASIYGMFDRWIEYQFCYNYLMNKHNLDFLEDTLRFITTGQRDYSLLTWKELVARDPDYIVRANSLRHCNEVMSKFGIKKDTDLKHYISMWCSQAGGFEDMLYTTWILFGSPDGAIALND